MFRGEFQRRPETPRRSQRGPINPTGAIGKGAIERQNLLVNHKFFHKNKNTNFDTKAFHD